MSIKKAVLGLSVVAFTLASAGAYAQDRYDGRYDDRDDGRGDERYDDRYDSRYDGDERGYDYARVVDVQPLTRRVRVTTPQRECWDETRLDDRRNGGPRTSAGGAILGAVIGGVIGHQIGSGRGRDAATAAGAVIGAGVGARQGERNSRNEPAREYTVERCDTRYSEHWEERVDGYRVTYVYNGHRQVTQLPYKPGDRIRVRVDVSPAE
jgi:uncharacterized protein YcfJ